MAKRPAVPSPAKRTRGRPVSVEAGVGREGLIAAARKLLEIHPPAKVTTSLIAREAGSDPALIRYHFGDRASLLLAVVEDIMASRRASQPTTPTSPEDRLAQRIRNTASLARRARSMQRLLVDELAEAKSPEIRARVRELNAGAVARCAELLDQQRPDPLVEVDALFLHVAIVGICEFFAAGQSVIRPLADPKVDSQVLADRYEQFVIDLFLNGLRPRP